MNIQPIHTQIDYQNALERAEKIFDAEAEFYEIVAY